MLWLEICLSLPAKPEWFLQQHREVTVVSLGSIPPVSVQVWVWKETWFSPSGGRQGCMMCKDVPQFLWKTGFAPGSGSKSLWCRSGLFSRPWIPADTAVCVPVSPLHSSLELKMSKNCWQEWERYCTTQDGQVRCSVGAYWAKQQPQQPIGERLHFGLVLRAVFTHLLQKLEHFSCWAASSSRFNFPLCLYPFRLLLSWKKRMT